ncbi:MAG: hypothetical protein PHT07_23970 [Paludibacter sp.]|nr:hypothetical protein [Paludibacter sp.]
MNSTKVNFRLLSDQKCVIEDCRVLIKQNVVNRHPGKRLMCFKHYQARVCKNPDPRYNNFRAKSTSDPSVKEIDFKEIDFVEGDRKQMIDRTKRK